MPTPVIRLTPRLAGEGAMPGTPVNASIANAGYKHASAANGYPISGTIVKPHTEGGLPQGANPHDVSNVIVEVDPEFKNESSRVRLGSISPERVEAAKSFVRDNIVLPPGVEPLDAQRMAATAVFQVLDQMIEAEEGPLPAAADKPLSSQGLTIVLGQPKPNWTPAPPSPDPIMPPRSQILAPPPAPPPPTQLQPMQFGQAPAPAYAPKPAAPITNPFLAFTAQPPPAVAVGADAKPIPSTPLEALVPKRRVTFGFSGANGGHTMFEALYHDVIIGPETITLVYDTRFPYGVKYFPPATANGAEVPAIALDIEGHPQIYLAHTTGIQVPYESKELCTLIIERAVPRQ